MAVEDTEPAALDDGPFTPQERRRLRSLLLSDARASWLRRQIRVLAPWAVAFVAGTWGLIDWIMKHLKWNT